MVLTETDPNSALKALVRRTWRKELANEILRFTKRWQVDLPKLLARLEKKGQNYWSGMAVVLDLADRSDYVHQCSCGDIFGLSEEIMRQLNELYPNLATKCKECDPDLWTKIRQLGGSDAKEVNYAILLKEASKKMKLSSG
jgi:hypothetical protein